MRWNSYPDVSSFILMYSKFQLSLELRLPLHQRTKTPQSRTGTHFGLPFLPAATLLIGEMVRFLLPPPTRHDLGGATRAWNYFTVKQA